MSKANSNGNGRGIPAAACIRQSSSKQDASPAQQREAIGQLAARGGYRVTHEYHDDGISGDRIDKRDAFQQMIRDAVAGKFKVILAWDMDRFSRADSIENSFYIHQLRRVGVKLVTVAQGPIDWDTFQGRLMYNIQQEGKHAYLVDLSRNTLRAKLAAARRGEWLSRRPHGYAIENKRLVPGDPRDVSTVRRMFREYLGGHSLRAIAVGLNRDGIRSQLGNLWHSGTVKDILNNVAYIGTFVWNENPRGKYHVLRDNQIQPADPHNGDGGDKFVIEDNHPALIDRATFDGVQQRMLRRRRATTPHRDGGDFVLSNLCRCGKCHGPMYGDHVGASIRYRCQRHSKLGNCDTNAFAQSDLLDHVLTGIETHFRNPNVVERFRSILVDKLKQSTDAVDVRTLQRQLAKVDQQLTTARRNMAFADGDDLRREYELVVRELRQERDRLDASIQKARKPSGRDGEDLDHRITKLVGVMQRLRETVLAAPVAKQRETLAKLVDRVEVWSSRSGGPQTTWYLERGVVHLRADAWVTTHGGDDYLSGLSI